MQALKLEPHHSQIKQQALEPVFYSIVVARTTNNRLPWQPSDIELCSEERSKIQKEKGKETFA